LSIVEGLNWKPKKPETKHHEFIEDLIQFLASTLSSLQPELSRACYLTAFQHLSGRVTELLATSKAIKELNQAAFLNLWLDYQYIRTFLQSQKVPHE
jgi:hypothetical protein